MTSRMKSLVVLSLMRSASAPPAPPLLGLGYLRSCSLPVGDPRPTLAKARSAFARKMARRAAFGNLSGRGEAGSAEWQNDGRVPACLDEAMRS